MSRRLLATLVVVAAAASARAQAPAQASAATPGVTRVPYGTLPDGRAVEQFTLVNRHGVEVRAITYGAIITSLRTPDRRGTLADIVYGHDDLAGYVRDSSYYGAVVGRFANRIARGRFVLDGRTYELARNDGPNHLHGGRTGFDRALWSAEPFERGDTVGVTFRRTSPDGEEGYPGTLAVTVRYGLTAGDALVVDYEATTDRATPVNLSQHTYWNLHGGGRGTVLDHRLTIDASAFTPVDSTLIPTGERAPVAGTPFDFRTPTAIGARIGDAHQQLRFGGGYDHNWVLDRGGRAGLVHAVRVEDPATGRTLDIATTEPGLQFYSGNFLKGKSGRGGEPHVYRGALVLETQHFPDAPNQPTFSSTILRQGETLRSRTVFTFGVVR